MWSDVRLLLWLSCIHLAGVSLFTKGFLLSRLALSDRATCSSPACVSLATHKRAVLLVIDALRFDFIAEHPPEPASPFHHNILALPRELTAANPDRSFIFNAYSDPPTTTLQRLKAITTGSLPTFIDAGDNFGGSSIHEDSLIHQLRAAGRRIAVTGDDTWLMLFPDAFEPNMTFAFDSFNVEDLHTVDEGVINNLLPLMQHHRHSWDFAVGHCLGVDHAGHRLGPNHPVISAKLEQMNDFLHDVIAAMDDDTLLVLLGDHGMDRMGNHGGDSVLETMSALWIYSKIPLSFPGQSIPDAILPMVTFPGATVPHRHVQQIDLVPTLSLLLGLPIPFNNLGSVIPELFYRGPDRSYLQTALQINAAQIRRYLDAYRSSPSGKELDGAWNDFSVAWAGTNTQHGADRLVALVDFTRSALSACRVFWAQFNVLLMGAGLVVIASSIVAGWALYSKLGDISDDEREKWVSDKVLWSFTAAAVGGGIGCLTHVILHEYLDGVAMHQMMLFAAAVPSSFAMVVKTRPKTKFNYMKALCSPLILLVMHTACLASNSFTVWEDRIVLFLLISSIVPSVLTGLSAPIPRLRNRILGFSFLFTVCTRLMATSTVCREEQRPYCTSTFYGSESSSSTPPTTTLLLALPCAIALPKIVRRILETSKSDSGLAAPFISLFLVPGLIAGTTFWVLEWAHSAEVVFLGDPGEVVRIVRTILARTTVVVLLMGGIPFWWTSPICLAVLEHQSNQETPTPACTPKGKPEVAVLGFANAFGSPYLIFWSILLCIVWLMTQLSGQVVLGLGSVALLSYLEVVDSVRDVRGLNNFGSRSPSSALDSSTYKRDLAFSEIIPLALLAMHTYHGTGHQSTFPSLQWKSAFILSSEVVFPWSHSTVMVNTFGAFSLMAVAAPLLVLWNVDPVPRPRNLGISALRAGIGMCVYFSVLVLGAAAVGAVLRRHLMVWKVFAPRYLFAVFALGAVDVGVLVGVGVGVGRVREEIGRVFRAAGGT